MNFPIDQPILQWIYYILNTAGIGGVVVSLAGGGTLLAFVVVFVWIRQGGFVVDEDEVYTYPTAALHEHDHAE